MFARSTALVALATSAICFGSSAALAAGPATYVIHISIDGLRPDAVTTLGPTNTPNFYRLRTEGAFTDNARADYNYTTTLPNHTTQLLGRGVNGATGHGWQSNSTPTADATVHKKNAATTYVYKSSAFDVAHDNGLRTGAFVTKTKFSFIDLSYDADNGAADAIGADNGKDKIDTYSAFEVNSAAAIAAYVPAMKANPYHYSFVHLQDPDGAGHGGGGFSLNAGSSYLNAVKTVDGYLGEILNMIDTTPALAGKTTILLTADHGGTLGQNGEVAHNNESEPQNYTIPFYVWGAGVTHGDLYAMNAGRTDPGTGRPTYVGAGQPIRNGDIANLSMKLLGLESVPGSTIGAGANTLSVTAVPEPTAAVGLGAMMMTMLGRSRRGV